MKKKDINTLLRKEGLVLNNFNKAILSTIVDACIKSLRYQYDARLWYGCCKVDMEGNIIALNLNSAMYMPISNYDTGERFWEHMHEYDEFILPDSLGELVFLQKLILSENTIYNLPESIGNLSHLEYLDIRNTYISSLPRSLCKLHKLRSLSLDINVNSYPSEMKNMESVEYISFNQADYWGNRSREKSFSLPDCILKLKNLKLVDISYVDIDKNTLMRQVSEIKNSKRARIVTDYDETTFGKSIHEMAIMMDSIRYSDLLTDKDGNQLTVFLSYCWHDKKAADTIDEHLSERGVLIKRDLRDIGYWKSIRQFMKSIRDQDFAILIISDCYLKSINCMYEVQEIMKEKEYSERIFPVVLESKIYDTLQRIEYIKYWESKYDEMKKKLSDISPIFSVEFLEDIRKVRSVLASIGEFMALIADMNNPEFDDVNLAIEDVLITFVQNS